MIVVYTHKKRHAIHEQVACLIQTISRNEPIRYFGSTIIQGVGGKKIWAPVKFFLVELVWSVVWWFRIFYLKFFKSEKKIFLVGIPERLCITPLARLMGLRPYWALCESSDLRGWRAWLYRYASRDVDIVTFSQALLQNEKEQYRIRPKNIQVVRPVLFLSEHRQEDVFHEMAYKRYADQYQRNFVLGVIADLHPASGIEHVFQVVKILSEQLPNIQLIVVGDGPEKKNLLWLAKNMRIDEHLRIIAGASEISLWMKSFTVFLYSHKHTSWYAPEILLAMYCGRPIIANKTPYTQELLENTKEAILLDITNKEMIAQAVINMANNPQWLEDLSKNVQLRAHEVLADKKYEEQIQSIFEV